ncbi:hypothetical protein GJ744_001393 [Endocarpon pusillum]|uniref:Uncharacterized protein n=1 Tax=Endocarpon pusillum TaxID=364733 RepID=A0A8H7E8T3_9EURO|nr:hypothetical protein GJ744_001393 [Endocarpon pusillum]
MISILHSQSPSLYFLKCLQKSVADSFRARSFLSTHTVSSLHPSKKNKTLSFQNGRIQHPVRDQQDLNKLAEVKNAMRNIEPQVTTASAGETVTLKAKLGVSNDGRKALWAGINYTDKWFTLRNAKVNESGEIEYTFATQTGKKTPEGNIVRLEINWSTSEGMVHGNNNTFWYKYV